MKIVIVGCGNVGRALVDQLSREEHDIVIIDTKATNVSALSSKYDILGIIGNGASYSTLKECNIDTADLLIAVTGSDELNLLCCVIAKKAGNCHTIARVRNPVYRDETEFIRQELGISMIVNPELAAANEIARLIKYPSAIEVDSFTKEKIELLKLKLTSKSKLCNCALKDIKSHTGEDILICMVERDDDVMIPDGNFILKENDNISIITSSKGALKFLKKIDFGADRVRSTMIAGGGETTVYLAEQLIAMGIQVKIIERDPKHCEELCELLPHAIVICGDGTDKELLEEEGISDIGAFVSCTNFDEENILLSLYIKSISQAKPVTRIHHVNFDKILKNLDIGSVIFPKFITAEYILRYVRAMQNSIGSNVETLYQLIENKVEALEFIVRSDAVNIINKPLSELKLKDNLLICCIQHKGKTLTPTGHDIIYPGDTVVVVTTHLGLQDINDILK